MQPAASFPLGTKAQPRLSWFVTAICALGAALATYLGWLKLLDLPCLNSGCDAVLSSSYGKILGLPTGYIGLFFWLALFVPMPLVRRSAALCLGLGAIGFMAIQFLVLHAFCIFCTTHAALAVTVTCLIWRDYRPSTVALALPLLLPLPILAMQQRSVAEKLALPGRVQASPAPAQPGARSPGPAAPRPTVTTAGQPLIAVSPLAPSAVSADVALQWFGPLGPADRTPVAVLSLACHHCLDTFETVLHSVRLGSSNGSKVLLFTSPQNFELTQYVVAATMLYPTPSDGFTAVFLQLHPMRDMLLSSNTDTIKAYMLARFPRLWEKLPAAAQLLKQQSATLAAMKVAGFPTFVFPDGRIKYHFTPDDVLLAM